MSAVHFEASEKMRVYLRDGHPVPSPLTQAIGNYFLKNFEALPRPDTDEAVKFLNETKPERYAHIAPALGLLLKRTFSMRPERDENGLLPTDIARTAWDSELSQLKGQYRRTFRTDINELRDTPPFQRAHQCIVLTGYLDSDEFIDGPMVMNAGVGTALNTNFLLLDLLPQVIKFYSPFESAENYKQIALNSAGLSYTLSRRSLPSLKAVESILVSRGSSKGYDATTFKPIHKKGRLVALKFRDLEQEVVPAGFQPYEHFPIPLQDTPVEKLEVKYNTVGCPVSYLNGSLKELWRWMVSTYDQRKLWGQIY